MKFSQLAVDQVFEHAGERYVKIGPLTARHERTGQQKFLARAALVQPIGGSAPEKAASKRDALPADQVLAAFEDFHDHCLKTLAELRTELPPAQWERAPAFAGSAPGVSGQLNMSKHWPAAIDGRRMPRRAHPCPAAF